MNTEQKRSLAGIACLLLRILYTIGGKYLRRWLDSKRSNPGSQPEEVDSAPAVDN